MRRKIYLNLMAKENCWLSEKARRLRFVKNPWFLSTIRIPCGILRFNTEINGRSGSFLNNIPLSFQ